MEDRRLQTQLYLLMFHHPEVTWVLEACQWSHIKQVTKNKHLVDAFFYLQRGDTIPEVMRKIQDDKTKRLLCGLLVENYEYTSLKATREAMSFVKDVNKLIAEA
tara:strand:- start:473 stop:784 length:312 start_codon:yes stop_codon:yes gene_type:complete